MLSFQDKLARLNKISNNIQAEINLVSIVCQSLENQVNPKSSQLMQISQKSIILNESSLSRKKVTLPKIEDKSTSSEQINMHSAQYEDCKSKIGQLINKVSPSSMRKSKLVREKKVFSQSQLLSQLLDDLKGNQIGTFSDDIIENLLSKIDLEQERYCKNVVTQEGLKVLQKKEHHLIRELAKYQEALEKYYKRAAAEEEKITLSNKEIVKIGYNRNMKRILPS